MAQELKRRGLDHLLLRDQSTFLSSFILIKGIKCSRAVATLMSFSLLLINSRGDLLRDRTSQDHLSSSTTRDSIRGSCTHRTSLSRRILMEDYRRSSIKSASQEKYKLQFISK